MERIDFQQADISGVLDRLPREDRHRLPFGVVKLDARGTILEYNMAEAEISGVKPEDVIGKNFFLDVAVCTQRPEFYGRFRDAMDNNKVLNLIFDYEFQNALYAPVHDAIKVRVHMASTRDWGGEKIVWLMVKRVTSNAAARPSVHDVARAPAIPAQPPRPTRTPTATPAPHAANLGSAASLVAAVAAIPSQPRPHSQANDGSPSPASPAQFTAAGFVPMPQSQGPDIIIRFNDL